MPTPLPAQYPLSVYQGDTFVFEFRLRESIYNPSSGQWEPSDYIDLTGSTPKAQIREKKIDTNIVAEFTCAIGNQTNSPGLVTCELTAAATAAIADGNYVYDIQLTDGAGDIRTYLQGSITVIGEVTRDD